jgi:hypothetical protein
LSSIINHMSKRKLGLIVLTPNSVGD